MRDIDLAKRPDDYNRVERAINYIEQNFKQQPTLGQMARSVHLSKFHFNRVFKRWAGISPNRFLQFLTLDYTKKQLAASHSLLSTALSAGLSGPSRLHDLFVTFEAMTPGQFKQRGEGLQIVYGFSHCPFGEVMIATTQRGICRISFLKKENRFEMIHQLCSTWPRAEFTENQDHIQAITDRIFAQQSVNTPQPLRLHVKGTNFQVNVWQALLAIPPGRLVSYHDIATSMGKPKAVRAVASAVAGNPVAYLIPCHRVIAKTGKFNKYRWGATRKKAMIAWEAAANM
jgi:AraC family transcriptional regulator of adaptative response/methylated-DNA-[protein]-cysteine methyltransferase